MLSDHFYYFGDKAKELPENLQPIIKSGQGRKSKANEPFVNDFVKWINKFTKNKLYGKPQIIIGNYEDCLDSCSKRDFEEDKIDLRLNEKCG